MRHVTTSSGGGLAFSVEVPVPESADREVGVERLEA